MSMVQTDNPLSIVQDDEHRHIRDRVITKLARVLAEDPEDFRRRIALAGGDHSLTPQRAMAVIALMEEELGCTLPAPDVGCSAGEPAETSTSPFSTVNSLANLIVERS